MAWFRRTQKLLVHAFHALPSTSRLSSHNSIFHPCSTISQSGYSSFATKGATYNAFSKRLGTSGFEIHNNFRRFYSVDSKNLWHFMPRTAKDLFQDPKNVWHLMPREVKDWFQDPKNVFFLVLGVVSSGAIITVCFQNKETIPYTNRTHVILVSDAMDKKIGDCVFEKMKVDFKNELLPATHPQSVRVTMIANNILDAMKIGLSKENEWSDLWYGSGRERVSALTENEGKVQMDDETLDDKWIQKGKEQRSQPYTSHLDGLNWEILVVDKPFVDAFCLPGGKIVVFTGLLEHFSSDAEIATILGREVGHVVARHTGEQFTENLWFLQLKLRNDDNVNRLSSLFFHLPFSRRMEIEADYIGLILVASAGYDPRVAPKVLEKLGKVINGSDSKLIDYRSTQHTLDIFTAESLARAEARRRIEMHAQAKEEIRSELQAQSQVRERVELLDQAQVMDEALTMYKNVRA